MARSGQSSLPISRTETLYEDAKQLQSIAKTMTETPVSTTPSIQPQVVYSTGRKFILLLMFCVAQFLDVFNNSALFSAIPVLSVDLSMTPSQSAWVISSTQLTFAAFLLISGRISDVYNPKYAFVAGLFGLGVISLGTGFVKVKIVLFVLRAISGIFGSLTIPSALNLIVQLFPEAGEQSKAISMFGATGGLANMIGLLIGAIFVQLASWQWIFWFAAIISIPLAIISLLLIPTRVQPIDKAPERSTTGSQLGQLDLIGVSILTVALILLVFSLTSASAAGWGSAQVLVPLIASIAMIAAFFLYERHIPAERAAVPPKTWFYPNFSVLFAVGLLPYFYWVTIFFIYTELWQEIYGWSAISTAVHMLPIGVACFAMIPTGPLSRVINPKWLILTGQVLMIIAGFIFPFANSESRYWSHVFPAFVIGSAGAMLAYQHGNIAIFRSTPPRIAGTVGAMFNSALQLGSAVGAAIVSSIETSIENQTPEGRTQFKGRAAAFWFLLAVVIVEAIAVLIFYRPKRTELAEDEHVVVGTAASEKSDIESAVQYGRSSTVEALDRKLQIVASAELEQKSD